ncbi:ribosome-associated GTPase EngA [Nitzschia inconspicua]|uniref:GTPase Der n=1 Tax=Nitzschia inconspicua TaxID=303405 RepID=A0A9K3PCP5_9STRA|nr:ribosome-associated GTPase EngA [Nitzschia inconspicua]
MRGRITSLLLLTASAGLETTSVTGFVLFPPAVVQQQPLRFDAKTTISTRHSMVATSPDDTNTNININMNTASDEVSTKPNPTTVTSTFKPSSKPVRRYQSLKKEPLIAILGRPNVGKSALVNRLAGSHSGGAIVADEEGITRDRTYRQANFLGENFQIVDTGGLVFDDDENTLFAKEIREQAMVAIDESSGVILVVDGQVGLTSMDQSIGDFLRKEVLPRMPVLVAVNKCESEKVGALNAAKFWNLGLGEPVPVSALHGVGTADVLERMFDEIVERKTAGVTNFGTKVQRLKEAKLKLNSKKQLPGEDDLDYKLRKYGIGDVAEKVLQEYEDAMAAFDSQERPEEINVAIVGRPNVGKSSLLNAIFGDTRAIVSEIAGTTRDSIDAVMERPAEEEGGLPTIYRFVDTAGIRRKGKIEYGPEFFMVNRALRAIRRADVALLVLDATAGVTEQDRILAQKIADDGRACAIICNKWDAVIDKDSSTYDKSVKYIRAEMPQIRWAPILFISAETGQRVGKIYNVVDEAIGAHRKRVSTSVLNEVLRDAILWQPPPARRNGAQAKIYYCNQVSTRPPTVVVFCNDPKLVNDNYRRYLDRKFRESLDGFEATPIRWLFRGRRQRDIMRARDMNGNPGDGGAGVSYPFPHAD